MPEIAKRSPALRSNPTTRKHGETRDQAKEKSFALYSGEHMLGLVGLLGVAIDYKSILWYHTTP